MNIVDKIYITDKLSNEIYSCIWISVIWMAAVVIYFLVKLFKSNRRERLIFISSFKKGNFLLIYPAAIPIFYAGLSACKNETWSGVGAFFQSVEYSATLIGLHFNMDEINKLFLNSRLYKIVVIICFSLVILNAVMFLYSFFQRNFYRLRNSVKWVLSNSKVLILGNNPDSISIFKSAEDEDMCVIADSITSAEESNLFFDGVPTFNYNLMQWKFLNIPITPLEMVECAIKDNKKHFTNDVMVKDERKYTIVVNTESDEKNLKYCREILTYVDKYISEIDPDEKNINSEEKTRKLEQIIFLFQHIQVYVLGNADYEALYLEVTDKSYGIIHYQNKYKEMAIDFVNHYPLTEFMTEEQIDIKNFLLRNDFDVNVLLIGFGEMNQQIFMTSVANNQFLQPDAKDTSRVNLKPIKYHIFDKEASVDNKNLSHSYYRYKNECFGDKAIRELDSAQNSTEYSYPFMEPYKSDVIPNADDYLPLPMLPAEEYYHQIDINNPGFYNRVRGILSKNKKDINYIVVGFGSDLENIDYARRLIEKRTEWGIENTYIFARVRDSKLYYDTSVDSSEYDCIKGRVSFFSEHNRCFMFGNERAVVFNLNNMRHYEIREMALKKSQIMENEEEKIKALYGHYTDPQNRRDSNFYSVLAIRSKLHLMGLDMVNKTSKTEKESITQNQYMGIYACNDSLARKDDSNNTTGFEVPDEPYEYPNSGRHTLAVQEHYRWNSYMLSLGFIPATRKQIMEEKEHGKSYELRRHGNLTTYDGLLEFYDMTHIDVIKYDYKLMDQMYKILLDSMVIVKRKLE